MDLDITFTQVRVSSPLLDIHSRISTYVKPASKIAKRSGCKYAERCGSLRTLTTVTSLSTNGSS
jgi:hypothetical protein